LDPHEVKPQDLGIQSSGWQPTPTGQYTPEKASRIQPMKAKKVSKFLQVLAYCQVKILLSPAELSAASLYHGFYKLNASFHLPCLSKCTA